MVSVTNARVLRRKLEQVAGGEELIESVYGVGYKLAI